MIDSEVERLRGLRATALRVRAIARALQASTASQRSTLDQGACAAWRVARTVSGRLRAHPFANFQKDASLAVVFKNAVAARMAVIRVSISRDPLALFGAELQTLAHELADARALTWATELSDGFGRSQAEIRSLLATLGLASQARRASVTPAGDWPYLAL